MNNTLSTLEMITGEPVTQTIVWFHGLGADASDMLGLAKALNLKKNTRHIAVQAPTRAVTLNAGFQMPAWFDIIELSDTAPVDESGLTAMFQQITAYLESLIQQGTDPHSLYLAGFSQGGAMALYTGVHFSQPLAGLIGLSTFLPRLDYKPQQVGSTPIFLAWGDNDEVVKPQWSERLAQGLDEHGFNRVSTSTYNMGHAICAEEIDALSWWLNAA